MNDTAIITIIIILFIISILAITVLMSGLFKILDEVELTKKEILIIIIIAMLYIFR